MKHKNEWIKKINNNDLSYLLKNKDKLTKTPDNLDREALNLIKNSNKIFKDVKVEKKIEVKPFFYSFKFAASFTFILLIIITSIIFNFRLKNNLSLVKIDNYSGIINILRGSKTFALKSNSKIKSGDIIQVGKNSNALAILNNSQIKINESSQLKIISSHIKKEKEITRLELINGEIICDINLPSKESKMEIFTDTSIFTIVGTKFKINSSGNSVILNVQEGTVSVKNNLNKIELMQDIRKKDKALYEEIKNKIEDEFLIEKNNQIILDKKTFKVYEQKINSLLQNVIKTIDKQKLNPTEKNNLINSIKNISSDHIKEIKKNKTTKTQDAETNDINKIITEDIEKSDINFKEKNNNHNEDNTLNRNYLKILSTNNLILSENNTQITSDDNNIYIASNKNKTIYCFNVNDGVLKWKFNDNDINNITTEAKSFKNNIIFATSEYIYVLKKDGKLKSKEKLTNGPGYWPSFLEINNLLLIPSFKTIYQYDGNTVSIYKDFSNSFGQLFINEHNENILFVDINGYKIKELSSRSKTIVFESGNIKNKVYMSPVAVNDYVFIGDINGNLYKFKYKTNNALETLNLNTGLISNLICYKEYLYFVANNGYFYSVNTNDFTDYKKISEVDINTVKEKYYTKKLLLVNNEIFYSSGKNKIFYYNLNNKKHYFVGTKQDQNILSFIGTPVKIKNKVYFVDNKANIYYLPL